MVVGVIGQGSTAPPGGWSPIGSTTRCGPPGFEYDVYYAWRIRRADDGSYSFPRATAVQIAVYADVDPGQPVGASQVARHVASGFDLGTLAASDHDGDAAHYQSLGVYHGAFDAPAGYTERQDGVDATTAGDRLGLSANQSTGGRVLCTDASHQPLLDDGVHLHVIVRARRP